MKETIERLLDDLDGTEAAETVVFGLDGMSYEADLSEENAELLRERMSPFVDAGRSLGRAPGSLRTVTRRRSPSSNGRRSSAENANDVRKWARDQGFQVEDRGRIKKDIVDAYAAAH